jgi:hypothetical protein
LSHMKKWRSEGFVGQPACCAKYRFIPPVLHV